jgi:hypothetical protein
MTLRASTIPETALKQLVAAAPQLTHLDISLNLHLLKVSDACRLLLSMPALQHLRLTLRGVGEPQLSSLAALTKLTPLHCLHLECRSNAAAVRPVLNSLHHLKLLAQLSEVTLLVPRSCSSAAEAAVAELGAVGIYAVVQLMVGTGV